MLYNYKYFILEKRNFVNKIKKFANVPEIYNWANETDSDQALWIANVIVDILKKGLPFYLSVEHFEHVDKLLEEYLKNGKTSNGRFDILTKNYIKSLQNHYKDDITKVLHYVNSPLHDNKPNINKLSLEDALKTSEKWHDEIEHTIGKEIENETGTVIMKFDDGYYWIDLETTTCEDEAEAMGHCGNTNAGTTILSLRDKKKRPHVTIAYNENEDKFTQIKGKGNNKPIPEYHKYIVDLIIYLDVKMFKSEYDRKTDFTPEDLSEELYAKLEQENPEYIENSKPASYEELQDRYRQHILDDIDEYMYTYPNYIWDHLDNKRYISDWVDSEVYGVNFGEQFFSEEDLTNYIIKEYDKDALYDYLIDKLKKDYSEDSEEYESNLNELNDDVEYYLNNMEANDLEEIIIELGDEEDFKRKYFENQYDGYTAKDLFDEIYGLYDYETRYDGKKIKRLRELNKDERDWLYKYLNDTTFADDIADNADEEYLRDFFGE